MKRVDTKVAVVTGGALGLGHATSLLLAREGARVAVTDIRDQEGQSTVQTIREAGGTADYWHLDVTDERGVERVFSEIHDAFGPITILVNNAGISGVNKPTHEIDKSEWDRVIDVNVKGVFLCTKYAIPSMQQAGGGSIINLSSIYGLVSAPDFPPYHASKGAVRLMSKTDAMLYAPDRIRVNSVHPAFIWTPMVQAVAQQDPEGEQAFIRRVGQLHPLGHMGEPDDIAYGILYLASDESKFVTGTELVIDGGYTAR